MKKLKSINLACASVAAVLFLSACAATNQGPVTSAETDQKTAELNQQKMAELNQQKMALEKQNAALNLRANELERKIEMHSSQQKMTASEDINAPLLPPDAKPGECYARVFVPAVYEATTETLLKKAESSRIEVIPATYKTVEKEVLVSEASEQLITIPAEYETQVEDVLVSERQLIWRTDKSSKAPEASKALLDTARKYGINLAAAHPGDCFHEHYLPPVYETVYTDELVAEESFRIEVVPARYEMVNETVLVSEASTELVNVPATYKYIEERVLVKEAHTAWKKGRGLVEKIDNTTGEIMCLIEVPAEYKTVRKKVVDQPAHTMVKEIPAKYKTVKVKKLVEAATERKVVIPAKYKKVARSELVKEGRFLWHEIHNMEHSKKTRTGNKICLTEIPAKYRKASKKVVRTSAKTMAQTIPAVYKTVKVKVVDQAAQERKITIPAEYQEVTKQNKISEGRLEWRRVLCETNTTIDVVSKLQRALLAKEYNPGPIDGKYGAQTAAAVRKYQQDNGFATGGITMETLDSLGL